MEKKEKGISAVDTAWEIFTKTGDVNYYLFYNKLKDKK